MRGREQAEAGLRWGWHAASGEDEGLRLWCGCGSRLKLTEVNMWVNSWGVVAGRFEGEAGAGDS